MKASSLLLLLVALLTTSSARAAADVELVADGDTLAPSTTLEVRFAREMVKAEQVGVPVTPAPLVAQPALAGSFTWLSKRSGVFTPTDEPAMGATYNFSLLKGLKDATGKPFTDKLSAKLKTPPFGLAKSVGDGLFDRQETLDTPSPEVHLIFNREVSIEGADKLFRFVDDKGKVVAAAVTETESEESSEPEQEPWEIRWDAAHRAPKPPRRDDDSDEPVREVRHNLITVTPIEPLSLGTAWQLEMAPGLRSRTGNYTLQKKASGKLGRVQPFTIEKVTTSSYLNAGRSVELKFSRDTSEALKDDTAGKFFKFTPEVKDLRFTTGFQSLEIHGDFQRGVDYHLEIDGNLRDLSGVPIDGELTRTLRFGPIKPRVYLPVVDGHQWSGGQRKFPVSAVNMRSLHVVAQLVPPEKTAEAMQAFEEYQQHVDGQNENERFHRVTTANIPGERIFDRTTVLPNPNPDTRQELLLDWTELMASAPNGTIFITIDGLPMAGIKTPKAGAQALVQMTDLGVLWKKLGDALQVSVFSMSSGKPVEGADLALLNDKFAAAGAARTDATGTATLPVSAELAWLTVRHGNDAHTLRMGSSATELPMAAFRLPIHYDYWEPQGAKADVLRALVFTDRPLYRRGETAHVKGIIRVLGKTGLRFLAGQKGTLIVSKPHDAGREEIAITTDEHGAFNQDLKLDPDLIGEYSVSLKIGQGDNEETDFNTSFLTADYQPNAFEVKVIMPARFAPGAEIAADAGGRYFFGSPLGAARAKWTLQYAEDQFRPEGFDDFNFGTEELGNTKTLTLHGDGSIAAGSALAIRPRLPEAAGAPKKGVLTVEITDENQQTVTQAQTFTRDTSSFYLGMKVTEGYTIGSAESIGAMAVALQPNGRPVPEPVPVKAELVRIFYETVRAQGAGPAMTYRTEKREEVVQTLQGKSLVPQRAGAEWALPPGETARFKPEHGGQYLLRLSAQDDAGRTARAEYSFVVSGSEPIAWDYRNPAQVEMVADKADYQPGDTARLVIKTPIAGEAMVNIERDNQILRTLRLPLKGNAPELLIPLVAGDGPNVFVSMVLIRGAEQSTHKVKAPEYRYGVCRLHVSEPETALAVKITPRVPKVEPGQEIVTEVAVLEANGKPCAGAEVTLFAVDDGVLALTGYERPMPLEIFEKPFALKIRTGLSLFEVLPEPESLADPIAAAPELANKGYLIGGGGNGGPGPNLRSNFPGTTFWEPSLKTGADGRVVVKFKAPDALTSYRLVAVASAGTNRFGSAESKVQISKRLILLSALGQFAHAGDELTARAVVRNESAVAGTAVVKLELDATAETPAQPLQASVALQPGEAGNVDFPVKLKAPGAAQWKWIAQMPTKDETLEDGLLASLQVVSPAPILHETYLPDLSAAQSDLLDGVNPQLLEGTGSVQVTLSNTRLASLRESSQALLEYPYGCAEQTLSSMIPWIVARDFGSIMPALADPASAKAALAHGLDKLDSMRTGDGGLAYWPGGARPDLLVSAYAVMTMSLMAKHDGEPPAALEPLAKYLSEALRGLGDRNSHLSLDDGALAVYALASAGKAEPGYHEMLFQRRAQLTAEGRAFLACAIMEQEKYKPETIEKLLDPKAPAPECICWWGSATRERAIRLLAWTKFRPKDKEVARITQELLAARINGAWRTTQENAWSLLALSKYFAAAEGEVKPVNGTLARGVEEKPFALTKEEMTNRSQFAFAAPAGLGKLAVTNPEKGALYGDVKFTVEPPVALQPRQNRGYGVSRSYFKIAADGSLAEAKDLVVGDRVVVALRLETTSPGHFVAIDDPLPAILEAVNPDFKSQAVGGAGGLERDWAADYREMRADRVLYFCDHLPPGTYNFRYLARVRAAGNVMAPSTKVEEMYRPERFGLGEGSMLTSKAQ